MYEDCLSPFIDTIVRTGKQEEKESLLKFLKHIMDKGFNNDQYMKMMTIINTRNDNFSPFNCFNTNSSSK